MEQLSEIFNLLGGAVTSVVLPLLGGTSFLRQPQAQRGSQGQAGRSLPAARGGRGFFDK